MEIRHSITEQERIATLREYDILDTPPEEAFDDVVDVIRAVFHVPIACISLIDSHRQWFKARRGLLVSETPREFAFCARTILGTEPLVIPDTTVDPSFRDNPLVVGPPYIRSYLGAPIIAKNGAAIGTVCAVDTSPRPPQYRELRLMRQFGRQVACLAELHRLRANAGADLASRNWDGKWQIRAS